MKISKNPNTNWKNNEIQFARLIAEMQGMGAFERTVRTEHGYFSIEEALCQEMDLELEEVRGLVGRACNTWAMIKGNII